MELTVDTSWWTRYRSSTMNPDLGGTFAQAVPALAAGKFPAIPRSDSDLEPANHIQAIANTAGFHFCTIEQGGTSLYPSLAQRVSDPEVLRVLLSIGPTEAMHFQTWHDKAGNAPPLTDPTNGLVFPDLNAPPFGGEEFKTNLIMPEPTVFLSKKKFPACLDRPPHEHPGSGDGRRQRADRRRVVHRAVARILQGAQAARARSGRGHGLGHSEGMVPGPSMPPAATLGAILPIAPSLTRAGRPRAAGSTRRRSDKRDNLTETIR